MRGCTLIGFILLTLTILLKAMRIFLVWYSDALDPEWEELINVSLDQLAYLTGISAIVTTIYGVMSKK